MNHLPLIQDLGSDNYDIHSIHKMNLVSNIRMKLKELDERSIDKLTMCFSLEYL